MQREARATVISKCHLSVVLWCSTMLFALALTSCGTSTSQATDDWTLVWSDEFDGPEINMAIWNISNGPSLINEEENFYTPEDAYIDDGVLVLRQQERTLGSGADERPYSSGQLVSRLPVGPTETRVEVRGKPARGAGLHSAYWLYYPAHWPPEIDILEVLGQRPNEAHMAWHYGIWPSDGYVIETWDCGCDLSSEFHTYAVEWDDTTITWYIDDVERYTTDRNVDQASVIYNLKLDTAIGGVWEGDPDGDTMFPNYNYVDYVRIYQRGGTPITPEPQPSATPVVAALAAQATATPGDDPKLTAVAAFASSTEAHETETVDPSYVIDSNTQTRWSSTYAEPAWIAVDLGAQHTIARVTLHWEAAYANVYALQVSDDGETWTTARTVTDSDGVDDDLTGLATTGRYVRIYGEQRATPYGFSLYEIEVYGQ